MGVSAAEFMEILKIKKKEEKQVIKKERPKVFDNARFGEFLEVKLKSIRMTQMQLAEELGVERSTISNMKNGLRPSLDLYIRICDFLKVEYGTFIVAKEER